MTWAGIVCLAQREGTFWNRVGPAFLVMVSIPLVMLDLTRHVLQDGEMWMGPMYRPYCMHHDVRCLSVLGWTCLLSTYAGFACLISGRATYTLTPPLAS